MRIAILAAMDKELDLLVSIMPQNEIVKLGNTAFHRGNIGKHEVIVGKCGIGKVNSALNTYRLITELAPDLVINSGVAGGGNPVMKIGDILVADKVAYHDVWCGPGSEYGEADGYSQYLLPAAELVEKAKTIQTENSNIRFGLICSGDKFIHTHEEVLEIRSHFPDVLAIDMESASIAQTCTMLDVPFLIVRAVSDTPGEGDNISQYQNFWSEAPVKTFKCVERLIEMI